jgi:putative DNA methylase
MSRAVVLGTLLPDPGDDAQRADVLDLIVQGSEFETASDPSRMDPLRKLLADAYPDGPPKVLDCFAGGGAIPLEAVRLGCDTTALELNPVAHLREKGCLEYPQRYGQPDPASGQNRLAEDFLYWADWVRHEVSDDLAAVFPSAGNGDRPAIYFWCRTMRCANHGCAREIPLVSSRWLANSSRRKAWIEFRTTPSAVAITVHTEGTPNGDPGDGTTKASSATCPACGTSATAAEVRTYGKTIGFGARLYAVCDRAGRSRTYRAPSDAEVKGALVEAAARLEGLPETEDGTSAVPDEDCDAIGYINLQNLVFGLNTWRSLFNTRQLYVLGRLAQAVRSAHVEMLKENLDPDYARALATYLGFLVDKIADYNSTFTSWRITAEASRSTFPRQAISMVWDYVETDPMRLDESGIWTAHARWIELVIRHCAASSQRPAEVLRGNAQNMPFPDETFDAVVVDPPYYISVMYSDLSDFFYVWLKRSVGHLYPGDFATKWTPKDEEIIQNRTNPREPRFISAEEFERRLARAIREMARVTKADGSVSIVYAHTDVRAWERLLRALRDSGLVVTTSWPMRSERGGRSNENTQSAVLGSSIVLVCRKEVSQGEGFYDEVVRALDARIAERLDRFDSMNLVGADYFASAVGPAFEVFAKYSRVVRLSGEEVDIPELMTLARQVVARRAMGKLLGDEAIGSLDPVSLLYLTWRWAYDGESIPADEAYKLERAFDVDLSLLGSPEGLVARNGSSFALRGPDDRKGLKLGHNPSMIDVMHVACLLWDAGRRRELEGVLGETGLGGSSTFWSLARALAEVLPDGNRERALLLGLTGNQENLSAAAARAVTSSVPQEQLALEVPPDA